MNQDATEHARRWRLVEVDVDALPWPMAAHRRNSRVLKVLPHLFFTEPSVRASLSNPTPNSNPNFNPIPIPNPIPNPD